MTYEKVSACGKRQWLAIVRCLTNLRLTWLIRCCLGAATRSNCHYQNRENRNCSARRDRATKTISGRDAAICHSYTGLTASLDIVTSGPSTWAFGEGLMTSRAEQLEDMAWECRALAKAAAHAEIREQLLKVAEHFDRLARHQRRSGNRRLARSKSEC